MTPSFSMVFAEKLEGLVCDIVVTMLRVGDARMIPKVTTAIDFQPKVR